MGEYERKIEMERGRKRKEEDDLKDGEQKGREGQRWWLTGCSLGYPTVGTYESKNQIVVQSTR